MSLKSRRRSPKSGALFFCDERQQADESCPKNCGPNGALIQRGCTGSSSWQNPPFTINQVSKGLEILVVHIHRTRDFTMSRKHAAHLLLLETSTTFTELLQVSARNCCHGAGCTLIRNGHFGRKHPVKLARTNHNARLKTINKLLIQSTSAPCPGLSDYTRPSVAGCSGFQRLHLQRQQRVARWTEWREYAGTSLSGENEATQCNSADSSRQRNPSRKLEDERQFQATLIAIIGRTGRTNHSERQSCCPNR